MNEFNRMGKILLATRNETEILPLVLEEIAETTHALELLGWELSVVIVDDSDSDEISQAAPEWGSRLGLEIEVVVGGRDGLGAAILQGFRKCLEEPSISFIINLDADGQHDARQMGDLLRIFTTTGAGITIGSRWTKGGRCYGLSRPRRFVSRMSSFALRHAGVPRQIKDPTTSFRVYRRNVVELISREILGFNGFSFFGAGIAVASAFGVLVNETPIHFRPRVGGQSNLSARQTLHAVRDLPRIRAQWSMVRRRESKFKSIESNPAEYIASRELEQLANTPRSTKIILDTLEPYLGPRILEIGAGLGSITMALNERGFEVTALEPDHELFERMRSRTELRDTEMANSTLDAWPAFDERRAGYDTVLFVNVLEHIRDDADELRQAALLCKPHGNIVVFVPATPSIYGSMDWISAHFRRYRTTELVAVAGLAGLEVVECRYFDPLGKFPYWFMYRVLKKKTLGSASVGVYDRMIVPLSASLPQLVSRALGGKNLVFVCRPG